MEKPMSILKGLRIVEGSAFVAMPLAGMTLAQLGADVIRFDRIGGGLDHNRWPVTREGRSLFWAGLNKGKRSIAVDMAKPEGREIIHRLICQPGPDAGIFLTNLRSPGWLDYDALREHRSDLIMISLLGDRRGGPQVDYTVNPAVGFPVVTGHEGDSEPVGHVLPAWDCIAGQKAALAVLAGERSRRLTGRGQLIEFSLKDVAAAMLGNLGFIGEVAINEIDRPRIGNALYGAFGQDFLCADGTRVMVIALTLRQWRNLAGVTGLAEAFTALGSRLGLDLDQEGNRYHARAEIAELLRPWFAQRALPDIAPLFDRAGVTWGTFRSFRQAVEQDPDLSPDNPMFTLLDQPGIGRYPVPGTPFAFGEFARETPRPAPLLGEHTDEIMTEIGYSASEIAKHHDAKTVAGPSAISV
jgi:2-methylfumaryl-CoA isomerase